MPCSFCHGTGSTRSDESLALQILRDLDKEGSVAKIKDVLTVKAPVQTTNFLINHKRDHIILIENRYQIRIELHAESSLISPHYLIEAPLDEERIKKNIDNSKQRAKKKEKENKKESSASLQDQKILNNKINGNGREDSEEYKKRKRKRKRRHQKDIETPLQANNTSFLQPLVHEKESEISTPIGNKNLKSSNVKGNEGQTESTDSTLEMKKEKSAKPRTRASAKKTIEGLKTNDNKSKENDDNVKNTKMGKKGWWDR
tara:strand:- start:621 stop:1394 length:774 start_codon:yes stop_codon:yes gene_type:complete